MVHNVAAILWSQFVVATYDAISMLNVLYFYINTFRSMSAVPNMDVFCSLLMSGAVFLLLSFSYFKRFSSLLLLLLLVVVVVVAVAVVLYRSRRCQVQKDACITYLFYFWRNSPQWARASSVMRFLDHTQRRTTVGRTPLDERPARRRDLYLTTHNIHDRHPRLR